MSLRPESDEINSLDSSPVYNCCDSKWTAVSSARMSSRISWILCFSFSLRVDEVFPVLFLSCVLPSRK